MKRLLLLFTLIIAIVIPVFAGGDWHDDLISSMNSEKNVQSSLAVDRDTKSGKITQATYRYSFKNKSLYKNLRAKLINREHEASNFILRPGEDGAILMKFNSDDGFRNYSLSHVKGKYHLIVSVNSSEPFGIGDSSYSREFAQRQAQLAREQAQKQAQIAREQAQKQREMAQKQAQIAREQAQKQREMAQKQAQIAREQAQKQREMAQKQAQLAREQAQKQREMAQKQAQLAREQAQKQREMAQKQAQLAREQAQKQREMAQRQAQIAREQTRKARASDSKSYIITINDNHSSESDNISKQIKAAENERKRLLEKVQQ